MWDDTTLSHQDKITIPPPKKTYMKELRTWLSALLRISNSLSTIYIALITCYHNYEM